MKRFLLFASIFAGYCSLSCAQTNIDAYAEHLLRAACGYLAQSPQFSFSAEIWREHIADDGQKVQFGRTLSMDVKRPDKMRVEIKAPFSDRCFFYNGKALTLLDRNHSFYGATPMPAKLDAMVDSAHDEFGIDLPLIDFALSDPYGQAIAKVQQGKFYAVVPVLGVPCYHLGFRQENIDWQIWIEQGPQPLIRKFVITHKAEEGAPEFTGIITHWNFSDRIPDSTFEFLPPPGTTEIQMRKMEFGMAGNNSSAPR